MRLSTALRLVLAGSLLLGLFMWVGAMVAPVLAFYHSLAIGGPFVIAGLSLPALVCSLMFERGRLRRLMGSGIASAGLAACLWLLLIWFASTGLHPGIGENWARVNSLFTLWSVYCMVVAGLFIYRTQQPWAVLVRNVSLFSASSLFLLTMLFIMVADSIGYAARDDLGKTIGVLTILTFFGLLLTMILARLKQLSTGDVTQDEMVRMELRIWCPRCDAEQAMQTGGGSCFRCGLSIKVMVP